MNNNLKPGFVNQKKTSVNQKNSDNKTKTALKEKWEDSWGFKPIFSYLYFLFIFLIKKKGTWIIPIMSFVVVLIVLLIPQIANWNIQNNSSDYYYSVIGAVFYFAIIICGFFTVSYATTKSVNIFNDCQTEGVEILIISKPIERWQIIFSKFFALLVTSIFISLINVIIFAIGFAFSWKASLVNGIGFGPTIGIIFAVSLLICILFGSLTALFSLKFGKKASSTFPFFIFSLLFMISMVVSSLASTLPEGNPITSFQKSYQNSSNIDKVDIQQINYNDKPLLVVTQNSTDSSWSEIQSDLQKVWNSSKNNGWWYKFIKWIDVVLPILDEQNYAWGGGIWSLDSTSFSSDYSYKVSTTDLPLISNDIVILLNSWSYQIYFNDNDNWTLSDFSYTYKNYVNTIANSKQFSESINDYVNKQNVQTFTSLYNHFYEKENTTYQQLLDSWNITTISASDLISNTYYYDYAPLVFSLASLQVFYNNYYNEDNYAAVINDFIDNIDQGKNTTSLFINKLSSNDDSSVVLDYIQISIGENFSSFDSNAVFSKYSYSGSDNNGIFVIAPDVNQSPNWGVIVFWCFITIGLFLSTTWVYFRNDFK